MLEISLVPYEDLHCGLITALSLESKDFELQHSQTHLNNNNNKLIEQRIVSLKLHQINKVQFKMWTMQSSPVKQTK